MRSRSIAHAARRAAVSAWSALSKTATWSFVTVRFVTLSFVTGSLVAGSFAVGLVALEDGTASAATHTSTTFVLDDQPEWVTAPSGTAPSGSSGSTPGTTPGSTPGTASSTSSSRQRASAPFDLDLSVRHAPGGATVEVLLFPRLHTRYDFENDVRDGPHDTPLTTTTPVALASLPTDPRDADAVALDLSVVQSASTGTRSRLGLACLPPTGGTCTGVYPVVVELQRANGHVLRKFTTFLTYVAGASGRPLELAWVVPIDANLPIASHPSAPTRALGRLSATDLSALETLFAQLHAASTVPVTLDASPQTLQALDRAGAGGRAADATLASMSDDPSTDQVLAAPYVPIDLGAFAGAGEPTEITAQMDAGATVFQHLHVATTAGSSPWVQTGPVGNDIAGGLAQVGATQLVVPKVDLAPTSSATTSGTWTSSFTLALSHAGKSASVHAAETDTWLDGQFADGRGGPVLAATQLLADLAMVHFERPDTPAVRGMVAVPPQGWTADPTFDRVLLDGLSKNPVVKPVTLSTFFSSVTAAGTRTLLPTGAGSVLKPSFARALSRARVRLSNFDDAIAHRPPVEGFLDDFLLSAESDNLRPRMQAAGVSAFDRVLTAQLRLVRFATEKSFTLTSRTGLIPITVESHAPYTVIGRLSVSGAKFTFPHRGSRRILRLDHVTNPTRIDVTARSSGDLPLHVAFTSPNGRLVIARDLLTVRSTATSLVGIVLSVVALAVLLTWWARSVWSGRKKRRAEHVQRARPAESGAAAP